MSQVSCRMKNGVWFPSTIQPSALETFIYALQLRIMHLSLPLLVSFLALFEHVVRLPSQCSKTAVRCELYVIKIWCRLGKFRDAAHPHVLIICCCGITSEVPGLHARGTRRVYEELLGSAERSVWACTFAYFDGPRAFEVLARRTVSYTHLRAHET